MAGVCGFEEGNPASAQWEKCSIQSVAPQGAPCFTRCQTAGSTLDFSRLLNLVARAMVQNAGWCVRLTGELWSISSMRALFKRKSL